MKGIMVPLLMLWMTGIVVGQQADSNVFQSTAYQPQQQNFGQGPGNLAPKIDPNDVKPMNLLVSDEQISGIRNGSFLDSKINPVNGDGILLPLEVVSGITLAHEDNQGASPDTRNMFGKNLGDGKLSIELDEWALADLKTKKLVFEIPEIDRGKYNAVMFHYKRPNTGGLLGANSDPGANPKGPSQDDSFGAGGVPFGPPNRNEVGQLLLPGPEAFPGSTDFVGPVRSPQGFNNIRPDVSVPINRPPSNPNAAGSRFSGESVSLWNNRQPSGNASDFNQRMLQAKQDADELKRRQLAANQMLDPARDRFTPTLPRTNLPANPSVNQPLSNQQIADRWAILEKQRQLSAQEDDLKAWEASLARQKLELENKRFMDSFKNRDENTVPRIPAGPVASRPSRGGNASTSPPDRWASLHPDDVIDRTLPSQRDRQRNVSNQSPTPTGGISKFDARIGGFNNATSDPTNPANQIAGKNPTNPTDTQTQLEARKIKRTEGFIYFMLLCSLGLNVYLGLISRGFYVRYNELADELRETFTATM